MILRVVDGRYERPKRDGGRRADYKGLAEQALADARRHKSRIFRVAVARLSSGLISSSNPMRDVALAAADPRGVVIIWRNLLQVGANPTHSSVVKQLIPGGEDYFDGRITHPYRRQLAHQALVAEFDARFAEFDVTALLAAALDDRDVAP